MREGARAYTGPSMSTQPITHRVSPFVELDRQTWSRLSHEIDVPLTPQEIDELILAAVAVVRERFFGQGPVNLRKY